MEVNKVKKYLEDILTSISNIEMSTIGLNASDYNSYEVSWIVQRGIEIIAEALKRIVSNDPSVNISGLQKIISTRNKITHEYDVVDNLQLYIIVSKHLPILKKEIFEILEKYNSI